MEISVGTILEGTVKSITNFGAFISLPGGRNGLVHISEIAHSYVSDVHDHLTDGQTVKVKVVGIDDAGRINLSIKKATPPPTPPPSAPKKRPPPAKPGGGGRPLPLPVPRAPPESAPARTTGRAASVPTAAAATPTSGNPATPPPSPPDPRISRPV